MTEFQLTVNGKAVTRAMFSFPQRGCWTASVRMSAVKDLTGDVRVTLGKQAWLGAVVSSAAHNGATELHVVGGAGLLRECSPRFYTSCALKLPVSELLTEAGSRLHASSTVVGSLSGWVRPKARAADALTTLAPEWRILADGSAFVGADTWRTVKPKTADIQVVGGDPVARRIDVAMIEPVVLPGVSWNGRRVTRVDLEVTDDQCRGSVYYADN